MFYCNDCAAKNEWPQDTMLRSNGVCEICQTTAVCNDVPSKLLPIPPHLREAELMPCDHVIGYSDFGDGLMSRSDDADLISDPFAYCPRCGEKLPEER